MADTEHSSKNVTEVSTGTLLKCMSFIVNQGIYHDYIFFLYNILLIKRNGMYFTDQQSNQSSKVEFSEEEEMLITMVYNLVGERLVDLKFFFIFIFYF